MSFQSKLVTICLKKLILGFIKAIETAYWNNVFAHFGSDCTYLQISSFLPPPPDFPGEVSSRAGMEHGSLLWKNRPKRRQSSNAAEGYGEQSTSEADIDSDSGYCSPKHNQGAGSAQRPTAYGTPGATVLGLGLRLGRGRTGSWLGLAYFTTF